MIASTFAIFWLTNGRLQGEDIRQVLSWCACSEVFERSSLELNREEYLLASDESLGSIRDAITALCHFSTSQTQGS